jgi:predicted small secreted protein
MGIKKILLIISLLVIAITVSGCKNAWMGIDQKGIQDAYEARIGLNKDQIDRLVAAGLLREELGADIKKSMDGEADALADLDLNRHISWWIKDSVSWINPDGESDSYSTRFTYDSSFPLKGDARQPGVFREKRGVKVEPYTGMFGGHKNILNSLANYKISVIKPPKTSNKVEGETEEGETEGTEGQKISESTDLMVINKISELAHKAKNSSGEDKAEVMKELEKLFLHTEETLLDPEKTKLIAPTKLYEQTRLYTPGKLEAVVNPDTLGYDLILEYDDVPNLAIRLEEINVEAVNKMIGGDGIAKDKYLIDEINRRVYLMEYPVHYINKISCDENIYTCETAESDLLVNLMTLEIKNKDGTVLKQPIDEEIMRVDSENSSFVIYGEAEIKELGFLKKPYKYGAIVLRDYLELNYMPNIMDGEDYVALGRRIRVTNFTGDRQVKIGDFIDKLGNVIAETRPVMASDLMGINSGGIEGKAYKLKFKRNANGIENNEDNNEDTGEVYNEEQYEEQYEEDDYIIGNESGLLEEAVISLNLLKAEYVDSIEPSTRFPGENIALNATVGGTDPKMIFYCLAVDINPFESGLYNGWIISDNLENGSLTWWNHWLSTPELNYNYTIDPNALRQFFMGNYSFDLRGLENTIILDRNVLIGIQEGYDKRDKLERVGAIRTAFAGFGLVIIFYAIILMVAWVIDVKTITGLKLTKYLTFGRWLAVGGDEDMPNIDIDKKHYMNFSRTVFSVCCLIGLGMLFTMVDIISVVSGILSIFGGLSEWFIESVLGRH